MTTFKTLLLTIISLAFFSQQSKSQVNPNSTYVQGYYRSDGTSVNGYYKTTPNNTNRDNYTTRPNVNPYTGTTGYIQPDNKSLNSDYYNSSSSYSSPSYSSPSYSSPSYNLSSSYSAPVQTGSRGGQYYINSNGNKTYIKRY